MSASVTLKIVEGPLRRAEFVYDRPSLCSVGRSRDCTLRLPEDNCHLKISRHHCLLDIDPPQVRICDLGSLNGTFVNGEPIGRRQRGSSPEQMAMPSHPDYLLFDGDEVRIGDMVLRVGIRAEAPCPTQYEEAGSGV